MENHSPPVTWKGVDDKFIALERLLDEKFRGIEDKYPNRPEFNELIKELQDDIHALEMSEAKRQGGLAQVTAGRAFYLSVFATLAAIAAVFVAFAR